ncbi:MULTISPECIES: hypothetical protein [Brucella/Ochrobactrum group]|uniref:hypothetical protein n=1 Tax=Brucella/Ochrobactrum group TaxID=2826938 RepID=UPI0015E84FA4|nr:MULTISPECIES: hypothetical protein [Brucella/Ochrobactrum group]MCH4541652.1 hypothetical protein [Ochrobactrum sp. A-1]
MARNERQMNFLLPIGGAAHSANSPKQPNQNSKMNDEAAQKRYEQIKKSLQNKGLLKSQ